MPSYKTHSIHIDKCYDYIDKRIELNKEDLKSFSFGPDIFIFSDPILFNNKHSKNSKYFFLYLLKKIKESNELNNSELISYLYGELSHFILDISFHPYVNYLTENIKTKNIINGHLQLELLLDNYIMEKYNITDNNYYKKNKIENNKLREIIDETYLKIFKSPITSLKIDYGMNIVNLIEENRHNKNFTSICDALNIKDIPYTKDYSKIINALNTERNIWLNPVTGEMHKESVQEIWNNSVYLFLETIKEVNDYLYDNKPLTSNIILDNLSYDTALSCENVKKFIYSKKY